MNFLVRGPIEAAALVARVSGPSRGAVATFLGVVRDHHAGREVVELEYTTYPAMAEAAAAAIVREAEEQWPVSVALQHRVGSLAIGDVAVAMAVGGDHRDEAFAACRYLIEEVKRRVPIWKRERYADGSEAWVDPTAPGGISQSAEAGRS